MANVLKAPGKYVQGPGEIKNVGKYLKKFGTKFLVIMSKRNNGIFHDTVEASLTENGFTACFENFGGECSLPEIERLGTVALENKCNGVIAIGGGKAIDTGKAVAANLDISSVIIPTIASNDSPCSGLSVVYNDEGVVVKVIFGKRNPDIVIVDSEILVAAPKRYLVAGMGDALSTYFEARACKKSGARNMGRGTATNTALAVGKLCYDLLIANGAKALAAVENKQITEEFENVLEANILLSGIGFESGGLAAAHAINDGFAMVPQAHGALHGEKVAYGTLCQLMLEKAPEAEYKQVYDFCKSIGLPTKLADLGISTINEYEIKAVAEAACVATQSTKNLPFPVTVDDVIAAIYKVNEYGEKNK